MIRILSASLLSLVILASEALAQAPVGGPNAAPSLGDTFFKMMPMFIGVVIIYYFLIVKPQQAKIKSQSDLLSNLKAGDTVVTSSGIFGRVAKSEKDFILIEIADKVKIKVEPVHVIKKLDKADSEKAA